MTTKKNLTSEASIQKLQSYYSFLTPTDLVAKYALSTAPDAIKDIVTAEGGTGKSSTASVIQRVMDLVFNTSYKGMYTMEDLEKLINAELSTAKPEVAKAFHKVLVIAADGLKLKGDDVKRAKLAQLFAKANTETDIKNTDFKIGYILSNTPRLSLNLRDVHAVAAFMNAIPTHEFSRAIPQLQVTFRTGRRALEQGKYLAAPTILRFLRGSDIVTAGTPDEAMIKGTARPNEFQRGYDDIGSMGMEIFTSPISMTPFSPEASPLTRGNRINDPFRPIMSIESFSVDVVSTIGTIQYKTAKLNLTLHDKSRLSEVSDLVRAEGFGAALKDAGVEITYGWSHPDDVTTGNVYGMLLNKMRVTETYSIINSKFSFDTTGQVKINLSLATKGAYDVHRIKILDGDLQSETLELERLKEKIRDLRDKLGLRSTGEVMKEVRVFQVLDAAESAERPDLIEFIKKVDETIKSLNNLKGKAGSKTDKAREVGQDLAKALDELYKKKASDGQAGGLLGKIDRTVNATAAARFEYLSTAEDPFLIPLSKRTGDLTFPWDDELKEFNTDAPSDPKKPKKNFVISLGALLMTFVGPSLMAHKTVSEVQFVFHTANEFAGKAAGQNLANMPIDLEYFRDIFQKLARARKSPNYSIEEFVRIIGDHAINNHRSIAYGMRSLYQISTDKGAEMALPKIELKRNVTGDMVANQMTKIMEGKGGTFKFPVLEVLVETMPARLAGAADAEPTSDPAYNVMRVHIYDKNASPYEPVFDMLSAAAGAQIDQNIDELTPNKSKTTQLQSSAVIRAFAAYVDQIKKAKNAEEKKQITDKYLQENDGTHPFQQGGNIIIPNAVDLLRDFIRETVPSIVYGSNLSAVTKADVQSMQDAQQQAIFMMRAGAANPTQPNGTDVGGLPVRVLPTTVNISTFGCPFINIMQQFFIDFGTGTTIDNIYTVTGITHDIKAGSFETKIKMTPAEAYGSFKPIQDSLKQVAGLLKFDSNKK